MLVAERIFFLVSKYMFLGSFDAQIFNSVVAGVSADVMYMMP